MFFDEEVILPVHKKNDASALLQEIRTISDKCRGRNSPPWEL